MKSALKTKPTRRFALAAAVALMPLGALPAAPAPEHPLDTQSRELAEAALAKYGAGYRARVDLARKLIFVTDLDEQHLMLTVRLLTAFTDAAARSLGMSRGREFVTIVLPTADDYRKLAPDQNVSGFYRPADRTLISIDYGRTLIHEFTHALHHAELTSVGQDRPPWIWEGLAALCEGSRITPAGLKPFVDARVITLQAAIRQRQAIPLDRLIAMNWDEFKDRAELCYAESRYLVLYLHEQGKLVDCRQACKELYGDDKTGRKALEKTLGRKLFEIEEDFFSWARKLEMPLGERRSGDARLGLLLQDTASGVKVAGMLPDSPAARTGRILVGDYILAFAGKPVGNAAQVVGAIQAAGARQTVEIRLRRQGRILTVRQPLGSPEDAQLAPDPGGS